MTHHKEGSIRNNHIRSAYAGLLYKLIIVGVVLLISVPHSIEAFQADPCADDDRPSSGSEKEVRSGDSDATGAFGGTLDGRTLYEKACASCHESGFNGAPRLIASDWPNYQQIGVEPYAQMAIHGVGIMPPRGGRPDLTDEQVRRAVEYILEMLDGS